MIRKIKIAHPDWLVHSDPAKCIRMQLKGQLPESIAGWMIVVGLKHPLRAVYGSDLKAAWMLLLNALADKWIDHIKHPLQCKLGWLLYGYAWLYAKVYYWFPHNYPGGRHVDPDPIRCEFCGWGGMRRWAIHTYGDDGSGEDVEPVDECPKCGQDV